MSFSDPYIERYALTPYPEVDLYVAKGKSFIIKSPWLELRGEENLSLQPMIGQVKNEWRNHRSEVVSDFLSHLSRWPICCLEDVNHIADNDSISPIAAFSRLRREYLITRLETWKSLTPECFDAKRVFATHYQFIKISEGILDRAAKIYGQFSEPVRVFRDQELGHWRLVKSDADQMDLVDIEPSKNIDRLIAVFESGIRESFFNFCLFVAICEGAMTKGSVMGQPHQLVEVLERKFGPDIATGLKLHSTINRDLAHGAVAYDFLSCVNQLTASQFMESRKYIIEIASLQNETLKELICSERSCASE